MKYDITKPTESKIPTFGKGTECIKILFSKALIDIQNPLFRCFFLHFAHISASQKLSVSTTNGG